MTQSPLPDESWVLTRVNDWDPTGGLETPVGATILASLTPLLWRPGGAERFGLVYTQVASPTIPAKHVLTRHSWSLIIRAPDAMNEALQVLWRAVLVPGRTNVRGFRWSFDPDRAEQWKELQQEVFQAALTQAARLSASWTVQEALERLAQGFGGLLPTAIRRAIKDRYTQLTAQQRLPVEVPVETSDERVQLEGFELFRIEATAYSAVLLELVPTIGDPVVEGCIELKVQCPEITDREIAAALGISTDTLARRMNAFRADVRRRVIP